MSDKFRPQMGHWAEKIMIDSRGALIATLHISGENAELMDEAASLAGREAINQAALSTASARLEWWRHTTRVGEQPVPQLPPCTTWWAQDFDAAVTAHCMGNIHRNDLWMTLVLRPRTGLGASLKVAWAGAKDALRRKEGIRLPSATAAFVEEFEEIVNRTMSMLAHLGVRRLGLREVDGVWFSEIAEAHHLIGNGYFRPIPIPAGSEPIGRQIAPYRAIFGLRDYQLVTEGRDLFCAALGFINYPARTHPTMFAGLNAARFDMTTTNVMVWTQSDAAAKAMLNKQGQNAAARGSAMAGAKLARQREELQNREIVYGRHSFMLTVRAKTQADLDRACWEAEEMLAKAGATIARYDDKVLKSAYFANFPGNARWLVRRGGQSSLNFAGYAPFNNVPAGTERSIWGAPLFFLRTTQNTLYPYHLHVTGDPNIPAEDVASWVTVGGMGSGKTSHNARKAVAAQRVGARSIIFDKDCGLAPAILANDGEYLVLQDGEESGCAPLQALEATPGDRDHLTGFLIGLIESDGRGGISAAEEAALGEQVEFQLSMPAEMRSIDGIWPMLGGGQEGAGGRLKKWGRTGRLGWAFDGRRDRISVQAQMIGFDTSDLLKNATVCQPMLAHILYRIQKIVYQARPLVIQLDECWQTIGKSDMTGTNVDNRRFVGMFNDQTKTIRKNNGAIGLITQSASDLLSSAMVRSIQQNFPTKEFFGDRNAVLEDLVGGFSLTPAEFRIVKQQLPGMRHALLVKRSSGSFIGRNDMSGIGAKVAVLSGRRSTYDLLMLLRERYGANSRDWVPHYEALAPILVKNPNLDPADLIAGNSAAREKEPA